MNNATPDLMQTELVNELAINVSSRDQSSGPMPDETPKDNRGPVSVSASAARFLVTSVDISFVSGRVVLDFKGM